MPRIDTRKRFFGLALAVALAAAPAPARAEPLHFLARPDGTLVGPLEPEAPDGVLCPGCGLLPEMTLDEASLPVVFDGREGARIAAAFGGLADGRHTAREFLSGSESDQGQTRLFLIDTLPPVLELLQPEGGVLSPGEAVFWVRMQDEGSGLPPTAETLRVAATLNGEGLLRKLGSRAQERLLILYGGHITLPEGAPVALEVSVWDRAGNEGRLSRVFDFKRPAEAVQAGQLVCEGEDGPRSFTVATAGEVPFGFRILLHPLAISPETREAALEFDLPVVHGTALAAHVADGITLTGDHPAVRIQRQIAANTRRLTFRIAQTASVPPSEALVPLTLRLPRAIRFVHTHGCVDGYPAVLESRMEVVGWENFPLPLLLTWQWTTGIRLSQQGTQLVCRVEAGAEGVVDPQTSWFAVDGRPVWFASEAPGLLTAGQTVAEGPVHFQVQLGSASGAWGADDPGASTDATGTLRHYEGEWMVRLAAPVIRAFRYDDELGVFMAEAEDEGTAPGDLRVQLQAGEQTLECRWEETSRRFFSPPLRPPAGVQPAVLTVTDRAEQSATQTAFWGAPPEGEPVSPTVTAYHSTSHAQPAHRFDPDVASVDEGVGEDGLSRVEICAREALPPEMPTPEEIRRCELWVAQGGCLRLGCTADICRQPLGPTQYARRCRWEWRDVTPPAIEEVECRPDGTITARIHDHGGPLEELEVSDDTAGSGRFDPRTGRFQTRADLTLGERIRVVIHARDKARNASSAFVHLSVPLQPPEVRLEVRELEGDGQSIAYRGMSFSVLLTATARDDSGLDREGTRPAVDGQPVPVLAAMDSSFNGEEWFVFGAANLEEGVHRADIAVADTLGLTGRAEAGFEIQNTPRIQDFRFLAPRDPSSPSALFSARIADAGGDLDAAGIRLHVDGQALPASQLYYHSESRYFAADGPLELTAGAHVAVLAAVDAHGHRAEQRLPFTWGVAPGSIVAADGGLVLEGVEIRELRPVDGDGLANPGELVRLYIRLQNPGDEALRNLTAELTSLDPHVRVETPGIEMGDLGGGGHVLRSPGGFDLHLAPDLGTVSRQDPYLAPLRLRVVDQAGEAWEFDFDLPVFQSRANPNGSIQLTVDSQARSTQAARILLQGTARALPEADIEVTVRLNGETLRADWSRSSGRYSVAADLVEGDNPIEVEAVAADGRRQRIQALVQRRVAHRPPRLVLTLPAEGAWFDGCGDIALSGSYDSGTSVLEELTVSVRPVSGGSPQDIPLSVTEGRFTGSIPPFGSSGFYEVRVSLRTAEGTTLTVVRIIEIASCT
jgi:hypothetical protein